MTDIGYTVIYEKSRTGWGAYLPDLPGCVATGRTLPLTKRRIREAIALHVQGIQEDGQRVPRPRALADVVEIGAGQAPRFVATKRSGFSRRRAGTRRISAPPVRVRN
jgi:predicted RNase H-like HicB family nuclease